jgi:glutathione peroxidase
MTNPYEITLTDIDGAERSLGDFKGHVTLMVNVASRCGLTPQYTALEAVHRRFKGRGFAVLGFPCNQFAGQEPGRDDEIKDFCTTQYDVTFPLFAKLKVNGASRHELYRVLTSANTEPDGPGDILWNFAKFLVGKDGTVLARFSPPTAPDSVEVIQAIEKALG